MTVYRIQNRNGDGPWYSSEGKFEDNIKKITGLSIPMPWESFRQSDTDVKILSSVRNFESLKLWFNKEQIHSLIDEGFTLIKYDVPEVIELPRGEFIFDYNKVITQEESLSLLIELYS